MELKKQTSLSLLKTLTCAIITVGVMAMAHAEDSKVDPTGTWIWTNPGRNGNSGATNTLVLKYAADSLTGTLKSPKRGGGTTSTEIADGKLAGDKISFNVTRTYGTNSSMMEFSGTVTTDAIKGTTSSTGRDGQKRSRKWEAKREGAGTK